MLKATLLQAFFPVRSEDFVARLKSQAVAPHIGIDRRVSKLGVIPKTAMAALPGHPDYAISLKCRKRFEETFGWAKTIGGAAKLKVRGLEKANTVFTFRMVDYNLVRIPKLLAA